MRYVGVELRRTITGDENSWLQYDSNPFVVASFAIVSQKKDVVYYSCDVEEIVELGYVQKDHYQRHTLVRVSPEAKDPFQFFLNDDGFGQFRDWVLTHKPNVVIRENQRLKRGNSVPATARVVGQAARATLERMGGAAAEQVGKDLAKDAHRQIMNEHPPGQHGGPKGRGPAASKPRPPALQTQRREKRDRSAMGKGKKTTTQTKGAITKGSRASGAKRSSQKKRK